MATGYTLAEAQEMLSLYKTAERELTIGQAKSYRIGSREFEAMDMGFIQSQITRFANMVEQLKGNGRTKRIARVVPRDL